MRRKGGERQKKKKQKVERRKAENRIRREGKWQEKKVDINEKEKENMGSC